MTIFENIKKMNVDELAEHLDEFCLYDNSPWYQWWDENYCKKCEPEICYCEHLGINQEYAWCELHDDKCKYFQDIDEMPSNKEIVKMWLESEI